MKKEKIEDPNAPLRIVEIKRLFNKKVIMPTIKKLLTLPNLNGDEQSGAKLRIERKPAYGINVVTNATSLDIDIAVFPKGDISIWFGFKAVTSPTHYFKADKEYSLAEANEIIERALKDIEDAF